MTDDSTDERGSGPSGSRSDDFSSHSTSGLAESLPSLIADVPTRATIDHVRTQIAVVRDKVRPAQLVPKAARRPFKRNHHSHVKMGMFRYCYYDPLFQFFAEQVLDAEYVVLPEPTKRTTEIGALYSSDYVCTPFKHMIGDYIESLELGANVLVQVGGPCRLGYYGELQESILRDLGYDFDMLNFSQGIDRGLAAWAKQCIDTVNPDVSLGHGVSLLPAALDMIVRLDTARDFYLANAGFEVEPGAFKRAWASMSDELRTATNGRDINAAYRRGMDAMRAIPTDKPAHPVRIGIVGEMFTAIDDRSNLYLDDKLLHMGVELHRMLNLTNRIVHYNEQNLRVGAADYIDFDMGPTSTLTIAAAHTYAQDGFDGVIHAKSSGCTPEIDCVPVLQRISEDFHIPMLYLTYDSQTSDAGLDTRLEAFYDMLYMRKEKTNR